MKKESIKKTNNEPLYDMIIHLNNEHSTLMRCRGSEFAIDKESNLRDPLLLIKDSKNLVFCIPMSNILYYEFKEIKDDKDPKKNNGADKEGKDA